ncbi:IS3 family transposase [Pleionea litopenaei]|uniref:IS3 family transposase n=1 Tax=Pleionea litopenaei TaxID=3070815 RepID=A0AA51X9K2_9GAMM|nr:IS3 family transposase [Pleionea sp. HL-JVS1]WMS89215.1 IS3 family transposase [Pleionea sp. HL-JVS1]WMS89224.1 IS3 family transposase [Pleionea sp. HL-JVS1]WMS89260.1 IS3 family transposase [Pleionea sp. HL-JVS1]WMS89261.1 IS3 family transposase [Pleionea sp. HL-JVS1]
MKKGSCLLCEAPSVKYQFIEEHPEFNVYLQCRALGVSYSGYYDWRSRPPSARQIEDERLLGKLVECFNDNEQTYGVPRLTKELKESGEPVNHKRVARLKRENNIYPKQFKAFVVTTDSSHGKPVANNLLNREFKVEEANQVWVSDITYIPTSTGWIYLAVIIDLYSRAVIGWQLAEHMKAELVCDAVKMAQARRGCLPKLFHSDRGCQYVSEELESLLVGVTISMSRKGNCWDNAVAESFFGTLKTEHVNFENYFNLREARMSLFRYIEGFYNRKRRHSHLDYKAPMIFEESAA